MSTSKAVAWSIFGTLFTVVAVRVAYELGYRRGIAEDEVVVTRQRRTK